MDIFCRYSDNVATIYINIKSLAIASHRRSWSHTTISHGRAYEFKILSYLFIAYSYTRHRWSRLLENGRWRWRWRERERWGSRVLRGTMPRNNRCRCDSSDVYMHRAFGFVEDSSKYPCQTWSNIPPQRHSIQTQNKKKTHTLLSGRSFARYLALQRTQTHSCHCIYNQPLNLHP